MAKKTVRKLKRIGWREYVALPDLGVQRIKAKVDTGARTSSLHALNIETFDRDGDAWLRFEVFPEQRDDLSTIKCEAKLLEYRQVRSSTGHAGERPVIVTNVNLHGETWPVELTLAARPTMGFRMLLGRTGVRGRFLIHPGKSYRGGNKPT